MRWRSCGRRRERSRTNASSQRERPELTRAFWFVSFPANCQMLIVSGGLWFGSGLWAGVVGDGGVEHRVELGDVGDLGVALLRDDEDARRLVEIDALTKGLIGADLRGKEAVGVDDHGHHATVGLKVFLREGREVF